MLVLGGQLLAAIAGMGLLGTAVLGRSRWTAHTAPSFLRLLAVLGASGLLFAATAGSMALYQVAWVLTLAAVPAAFALFSFNYYGIDYFRTRLRLAAFLALPASLAVAGVALSLDHHSMGAGGRLLFPAMMAQAGGSVPVEMMNAPLVELFGLPAVVLPDAVTNVGLAVQELGVYYASGVSLVAAGLLFATVARYRHLDTGLGVTLSLAGLWPLAGLAFMPVVAGHTSWESSLFLIGGGYTLSLVAVGLAVSYYGLFGTQPAAGNVGATTALEAMSEPVFVLNDSGTVLRLNGAAEETFGTTARQAVGQPLSAVVGLDASSFRDDEVVEVGTEDGFRQFRTTRSPVPGPDGHSCGDAVVLQDVTRQHTREQRLEVLTRVLRHNIRNDLSVIRGQAELLADGGVESDRGADRIREKTDELLSISERAREAQQVVSTADTTPASDVETAVSSIYGELAGAYPDTEMTASVPEGTAVAANPETLEVVLRNVIENACRHNDADSPLVVTSVDRTDDGMVRVAVSDNGPGMPETERSVLQSGTEDPLEHGSRLGLWTVKWGVTRMGGTLSFAENQPRGTVVQFTLPAADG